MFATVIDRVVEEVRGVSPAGAARVALVDGVAALSRLRGALDAAEARFAAAIDSLDDSGLDAAGVLRSVTHCSGRQAAKKSTRGEYLAKMPRVAESLSSGRIPAETVDSLIRAADAISPEAVDSDPKLLATCEARPADLASREIRDWIRSHQSLEDAEAQLESQRKARRASWFTNSAGMMVCNIEFDPVTGAAVVAGFDAETEGLWRSDGGRDGKPNDIRTPTQRRCDAIARLLGVASPHQADSNLPDPAGGGGSTNVVVVADLSVITGADPNGRCEILDTGPVPSSVLAQLPSNTTWLGALFDGPGRPLWLGRARRLANDGQRLMAAVRDRGCVNCGAPRHRCQVHHRVEWSRGGSTDIDDLALLCQRCHTLLHEGHIRLHRQPDGSWATVPVVGDQSGGPTARDGPITGEAAA